MRRQLAIEPPPRRRLKRREPTLCVEMDELQRILERQVRELAGSALSEPERSAFDRATEADVGVMLRSQERVFS